MIQLLALLACAMVALICVLAITAASERYSGPAAGKCARGFAWIVLCCSACSAWQFWRHWDHRAMEKPFLETQDQRDRAQYESERLNDLIDGRASSRQR